MAQFTEKITDRASVLIRIFVQIWALVNANGPGIINFDHLIRKLSDPEADRPHMDDIHWVLNLAFHEGWLTCELSDAEFDVADFDTEAIWVEDGQNVYDIWKSICEALTEQSYPERRRLFALRSKCS